MGTTELEEIDLEKMAKPLDNICMHCDSKTPVCEEAECLVGFSRKVLKFAVQKGFLDMPGASGIIPGKDFKPYYPKSVVPALAQTCLQTET